jgi:transposase InsO family protein
LSTIYHALRRAGLSRLRHADRLTAAPVRYVACHPGALLHVDHKKLGRVPPGGGHRKLDLAWRRTTSARWSATTTSTSSSTTAPATAAAPSPPPSSGSGARHRWTRPYRPQTNGKAERFIRTLLDEWAYVRLCRSNAERLAALPRYVDFYNQRRPHTAIRRLVALAAVNNVLKHDSCRPDTTATCPRPVRILVHAVPGSPARSPTPCAGGDASGYWAHDHLPKSAGS